MFLSNSVLRRVFGINEQISSTCFIGSKGWLSYRRQLAPVPSLGSVIIHLILSRKIIPRNESYRAAQAQPGCCTGDGFHSFAWLSFISVPSRTTVSCARRKITPFGKKSACRKTRSGYPCVIFVNPRWCRHAGHGLAVGGWGGGTCKRVQHPLL